MSACLFIDYCRRENVQNKKEHIPSLDLSCSLIYPVTNFRRDFISLPLKELKPPVPCARLSSFIASWKLLEEEEDDDPWLLKNPKIRSSLFDDDDAWFLSSSALWVNIWKSLSSLLPLPSEDDEEERNCFSRASLLNELLGLSFSEPPETKPLSQLLKLCPNDGSSVVVVVLWLPKNKRRAWLRSRNESADAEHRIPTRHTRQITLRDCCWTKSVPAYPTDENGQSTWRHSPRSLYRLQYGVQKIGRRQRRCEREKGTRDVDMYVNQIGTPRYRSLFSYPVHMDAEASGWSSVVSATFSTSLLGMHGEIEMDFFILYKYDRQNDLHSNKKYLSFWRTSVNRPIEPFNRQQRFRMP